MMRRSVFMLGTFLGLASLAAAQESRAPGLPDVGIDQRLDAQVPLDLPLRDESGRAVRLGDYCDGKPVVLVLAYYKCPRLCSLVLSNLLEGLNNVDYQMGKDYRLVAVSIDPREGPELAAAKKASAVEAYVRPGAEAGCHFLTGEQPAIDRLASAVGFRYAYQPDKDEYAHGSGFMILTPQGKIARYFLGLAYPPRDLGFALEDASAGTIGSPITRPLRLLCFGYDPATGKYTLMTMRLVQLGGLVTVGLIGVFLARSWRRGRRRDTTTAPAAD